MVQKRQLGSSNPETEVVSELRIAGKNPLRRKSPEYLVRRETKKLWKCTKTNKASLTLKISRILEAF